MLGQNAADHPAIMIISLNACKYQVIIKPPYHFREYFADYKSVKVQISGWGATISATRLARYSPSAAY